MKTSALVIFKEDIPERGKGWWRQFSVIIGHKKFEATAKEHDLVFNNIDELVEPGSIYEASTFLEELSRLNLPDGSRLSRSFTYKGYELWWINYNSLFLYFCLPYTQYRKLLEHLTKFQRVSLYQLPYKGLFSCYLRAYGCEFDILRAPGLKTPSFLPFGVFLQIMITLLSLPVLIIKKRHVMVFTGDKFEKSQDYDFRMRFIYEELRRKNIPFVEFIRSLESWKTALKHALRRKRSVVYSEAITFVGRFMSVISGGHILARSRFSPHIFASVTDPRERFKLLVATQYLFGVYDDIWAIRITKLILRVIGIRVALISAAMERNFHAVLGCKLNAIPTIGILHGVASRFYNTYDFLPGFDGEKMLSVDKYGLWSEWWKEYYIRNSKAYRPEQLYVSGPMRPLMREDARADSDQRQNARTKVLFVSEQLAVPEEVLPYLKALLEEKNMSVYLTFRPYRDGFEIWLKNNHPEILEKFSADKILRNGITDAIAKCDLVVGSHSTAVLEALFDLKPLVFFSTKKWGDYFDLKDYDQEYKFFAENPWELTDCVRRNKEISVNVLRKLQERFFGNPYKNGSKWMVEEAERILRKTL